MFFCNRTCVLFLHKLFNRCFSTGLVPDVWNNIIINPIPKSNMSDNRDPLCYRGIALAPAAYKLYCKLLNGRLSQWIDDNNGLADEQNGFRKGRSTVDQIASLTNIIDVREKLRKSTFCGFIDFKKAYDTIDRNLLWGKLTSLGIDTKMCLAIKSLYNGVKCSVRINSFNTDWFSVNCGLKQDIPFHLFYLIFS